MIADETKDQLIKVIKFALEQNKGLLSDQMPDGAFPYYLEGKLTGLLLAVKALNADQVLLLKNDIAETLALIMQLKKVLAEPKKGEVKKLA